VKLSKLFAVQVGKITGELSTIVCGADVGGSLAGKSFQLCLKDHLGVETKYQPYFIVSGVGANPAVAPFIGIPVNIVTGDSANNVANALRAALKASAYLAHLAVIQGTNPNVTVEGRWPQNPTNIADVDTGWTLTTTTAGSTTVDYNIGAAAGAGPYIYRPPPTECVYLRRLMLSVADSAVTAGGNFGALAALAVGITVQVRNHDGGILWYGPKEIKTNSQMVSLGPTSILGTTMYVVNLNLAELFGGEIPVNGFQDEDFDVYTGNALTGLDGMYGTIYGHHCALD